MSQPKKKISSVSGNKKLIAPSILSADFARLGVEIISLEEAGADWVHIDVMDGHFVPNLTIGPVVINSLRKISKLPFDVHLMIENPEHSIEDYILAGADYITVHEEAANHLHRTISMIKEGNVKAGVSLNPATPAETLTEILPDLDLVLVMSVNPGFGGQKFIPGVLAKIEKLARWRQEQGLHFLIEIDGGVSEKNAGLLSKAGCDVFVAGSAVFGGDMDYASNIKKIRRAALNS